MNLVTNIISPKGNFLSQVTNLHIVSVNVLAVIIFNHLLSDSSFLNSLNMRLKGKFAVFLILSVRFEDSIPRKASG